MERELLQKIALNTEPKESLSDRSVRQQNQIYYTV